MKFYEIQERTAASLEQLLAVCEESVWAAMRSYQSRRFLKSRSRISPGMSKNSGQLEARK